jgi:hypothetical protein
MMNRINSKKISNSHRRPFWLPASSFYFLIAGFAAASFFLVIGIMHDNGSEPEIVTAGLVASTVLVTGVVLREVVLRIVREKRLIEQKRLDLSLSALRANDRADAKKFTIEKNAAALEMIRNRSEAAKVFGRLSDGHREVFELCEEYRRIVAIEIRNIHPNSPRLQALLKGNEFALKTHKYHLLKWAELQSKSLATEAQKAEGLSKKTEFVASAKNAIERALNHYPSEPELSDSAVLLDELLVGFRGAQYMSDAQNALASGKKKRAIEIYDEALVFVDQQSMSSAVVGDLRARIELALDQLLTK